MIRIIRKLGNGHESLLTLGLIVFMWSIGSGAFEFFLPILATDLVGNIVVVGFLLSLPSLVGLLIDIPIGDISDKLGKKKIMAFGLCLMVIIGFILHYISLPIWFGIFLLLWGVAYQIFNVSSTAYIMDISPKRESAEYFSVYTAFMYLGLAIGPVIGGFLLANPLIPIPYFYSIMCAISLLITISMLKKIIKHPETISKSIKDVIKKDKLFIKGVMDFKKLKVSGLLILYLTFILTFCEMVIWTFEPIYFQMLSIDPLMGGLILSSFVLPFIIFNIPAGILADRYGKWKILTIGLLISGTFLILFGLFVDPYSLLVSAFLSSIGLAFAFPSIEGILVDISPKHQKGEIAGIWNSAEDLGYLLGPLFGGLIAFHLSLGCTFITAGIMLLISIFPVWITSRRL